MPVLKNNKQILIYLLAVEKSALDLSIWRVDSYEAWKSLQKGDFYYNQWKIRLWGCIYEREKVIESVERELAKGEPTANSPDRKD